jgi:GMP synthase (glutamine-hydrolysing)
MLLVLRTGDAVPEVAARRGNFLRWFKETVGDAWDRDWHEHDARTEDALPEPTRFAGILVTGSASSVTERAPWMLRAE